MNKSKTSIVTLSIIAALSLVTGTAQAIHSPDHYSLFGEASYISPGNASNRAVHLISDAAPGFAGINYPVEAGMTFGDLHTLSTDYRFEADDTCGGGSPRFQIRVDTGSGLRNIFAYIGPEPSYTGCPPSVWTNSGDLLETGKFVDTSQLSAGMFYDPYDLALAKYASLPVVSIQVVADSGWFFSDGEQAVDIDNTMINSTLFTYEPNKEEGKAMCKKGGWMTMVNDEGDPFSNQGDCVSFFATGGRNN